ncbi:MAG TPA: hypothetical protein VE866_02720 [Candidatus Binatia bacterium]|jgi:hypothetical protein|nr:hypothetical protein [Candidatus Binatia bacterium]
MNSNTVALESVASPAMNRTAHLLTILSEECAKVAQRASKASRFGLAEIQPGQDFTNAERIMHEVAHITAVIRMLESAGALEVPEDFEDRIGLKMVNVDHYLDYSRDCGTLCS